MGQSHKKRDTFFSSYKNKNLVNLVFSFLSDVEKINFLKLTKMTKEHLKKEIIFTKFDVIFPKLNAILIKKLDNTLLEGLNVMADEIEHSGDTDFIGYGQFCAFLFNSKFLGKVVEDNWLKHTNNIYLNSSKIDNSRLRLLLVALYYNSSCEIVIVSDNKISHSAFENIIHNRIYHFKKLDLSRNPIGVNIASFCNLLGNMVNISFLNLSFISLSSIQAIHLSHYLPILQSLNYLYLDNNPLSGGASYILISCAQLPHLISLSLQNVEFCYESAIGLYTLLTLSTSIQKLFLSLNKLDKKSIKEIIMRVSISKTLDQLFLEECSLDIHCAKIILKGLEINKKLSYLNLNCNEFKVEGDVETLIINFFKANETLKTLTCFNGLNGDKTEFRALITKRFKDRSVIC
jgi:hypothetical protein